MKTFIPILALILVGLLVVLSIVMSNVPKTLVDSTISSPSTTLITTVDKVKVISKGERECRRVLERIYGVEFPTIRPDWLKSTETKMNLEIDCYAVIPMKALGYDSVLNAIIACEYNGKQHYKIVEKFQTQKSFESQIWNDDYKKKVCELYGVHYIVVPYTVKLNKIESFIRKELSMRGILPQHSVIR